MSFIENLKQTIDRYLNPIVEKIVAFRIAAADKEIAENKTLPSSGFKYLQLEKDDFKKSTLLYPDEKVYLKFYINDEKI